MRPVAVPSFLTHSSKCLPNKGGGGSTFQPFFRPESRVEGREIEYIAIGVGFDPIGGSSERVAYAFFFCTTWTLPRSRRPGRRKQHENNERS